MWCRNPESLFKMYDGTQNWPVDDNLNYNFKQCDAVIRNHFNKCAIRTQNGPVNDNLNILFKQCDVGIQNSLYKIYNRTALLMPISILVFKQCDAVTRNHFLKCMTEHRTDLLMTISILVFKQCDVVIRNRFWKCAIRTQHWPVDDNFNISF